MRAFARTGEIKVFKEGTTVEVDQVSWFKVVIVGLNSSLSIFHLFELFSFYLGKALCLEKGSTENNFSLLF